MQPSPSQRSSHHDHLPATGPAVEDHGRVVSTHPQAAAWYRRAQRAADPRRAATALRLAVTADPDFALAAADLEAITGTPSRHPARRPDHRPAPRAYGEGRRLGEPGQPASRLPRQPVARLPLMP